MFTEMPPIVETCFPQTDTSWIAERLKSWDPDLDPAKLQLLRKECVTWNDGSLGCPMPGQFYTQALIPGHVLWLQYENLIIEVHTDRLMHHVAMPGVGFL